MAQTSPSTTPGARSAPIDSRRSWFERLIVVGPEPNPISATAFRGTEPPLDVGTGRFLSVSISRLEFSESDTVIGTWRSDRENFALFCSMSPSVAILIGGYVVYLGSFTLLFSVMGMIQLIAAVYQAQILRVEVAR